MADNNQRHYETVAAEIQRKVLRPGLWTRAFAETGGDDAKAKALYIRLRVAELEEEERILERQEAERRKSKEVEERRVRDEERTALNEVRSAQLSKFLMQVTVGFVLVGILSGALVAWGRFLEHGDGLSGAVVLSLMAAVVGGTLVRSIVKS